MCVYVCMYVRHGYADQLAIDGPTSYFAQT